MQGFWDPIGLSGYEFWDNTNEETIGWIRHAEIKHGRIAMAGFVGYCLQANGVKFPWEPFASITATTPPEQWDALPEAAKWQIILGIGFLEWWSEIRCAHRARSSRCVNWGRGTGSRAGERRHRLAAALLPCCAPQPAEPAAVACDPQRRWHAALHEGWQARLRASF